MEIIDIIYFLRRVLLMFYIFKVWWVFHDNLLVQIMWKLLLYRVCEENEQMCRNIQMKIIMIASSYIFYGRTVWLL